MTSKIFVTWLHGFIKASHNYNITPKQWDELKDQIEKVSDEFDASNTVAKLAKIYPNDEELGKIVRKLYT
jgi:hypothetical protein